MSPAPRSQASRTFAFVLLALFALSASAAIVPVSPAGGKIVARVPDAQKKVMDLATLEERIALFREDRERGGGLDDPNVALVDNLKVDFAPAAMMIIVR